MEFRTEKDSLGTKKVPKNAYYGVHTQRSIENFSISQKLPIELIYSSVKIKKACAKANSELNDLDAKKAKAIQKACDEILRGKFDAEFPLGIFQAGSGTSTNMNVNEVIANRASEILGKEKGSKFVHANDDVNKGQSTNNEFPSAIRVTATEQGVLLLRNLDSLERELGKKGKQFSKILKSGRTHLQDAVPITLGQEFDAYAFALRKHSKRIKSALENVKELGVGGTAVGTGLNTRKGFREKIVKHLNADTKLGFRVTKNGVEATQFLTDIGTLSSAVKNLAVDLNKISNDLRLLSSGPKTGFNEINLPAVEPGSSIMPGKVNPSISEAMNMACIKTMGNDYAITIACSAGQLELNTHMPLIGANMLDSLEIMKNAMKDFSEKCVKGITANKEQMKYYVEHSAALGTALNPLIGYDKVAELVKESLRENKSIKELVLEKKLLSKKEVEKYLNPQNLTKPNL
ncbi:MAG TPA: aspartate ammonia-lyase [archaeon]|nr:aspartate ammonia-lyase [archaeon]